MHMMSRLLLIASAARCVHSDDIAVDYDVFVGASVDSTLDNVMGGTSTGEVEVTATLDNVMGGTSSGTVSYDDSVIFEGVIDISAGGFAQLHFYDIQLDLVPYAGFVFEVDSLSPDLNEGAPLSFEVDLSGILAGRGWPLQYAGQYLCTLLSSFAVPVMAPGADGTQPKVTLWVPIADLEVKPPFQTTFNSNQGYCPQGPLGFLAEPNPSNIRGLTLTNMYQEGPYRLVVHSIGLATEDYGETIAALVPPVPLSHSEATLGYLEASLARGQFMMAKGECCGSGVGEMEMAKTTGALYETTLRQAAATDGVPLDAAEAMLAAAEAARLERASSDSMPMLDIALALEEAVEAAILTLQ